MALKTVFRALALSGLSMASATGALAVPAPPETPSTVLVGAAELARSLAAGGTVALDARGGPAYAAGHLPGAVPAWPPAEEGPEAESGLGRIRSLLAARGLTGDETVVLYAGDAAADREAVGRLFWRLRWAGCAGVRVLDGGLAAWRAAGGALEAGRPRRPPATFRPSRRDEVAVDAAWVEAVYGRPGVEILDLRDARGWERWETPPTFAAGHLPYSLPWDVAPLLPAAGGWPDAGEVRRRLGALGPREGDPVSLDSTFVLYGDGEADPRPGLAYLALALAGIDARIFTGGWRGWTAGPEGPARPIVRVLTAREVADLLARDNPGLARDEPARSLVLLDLREGRDFAIGHLPGARSLPFRLFPGGFEKAVREGWPGADRATVPLVLYCYGVDCVRSRKAGAEAARLGFRNVLWFRGGVREWRDAGYPLPESPLTPSTAPAPGSPGHGAARP